MKAFQAEETDYANYPIPKFYHFMSRDARERILYAYFNQVERDVKNMVAAIFEKQKAKNPQNNNTPAKQHYYCYKSIVVMDL